MKRRNKGFTLAEMLIVVAIIGILVAITTVTISNVLEKSREAVDLANIRSAFEELTSIALNETPREELPNYVYCNKKDGVITSYVTLVKPTQKKNDWQSKIEIYNKYYAVISGAYVTAHTIEADKFFKVVYYTTPQTKDTLSLSTSSPYYDEEFTFFVQLDTYQDKYAKYCFYRTSEKVVK